MLVNNQTCSEFTGWNDGTDRYYMGRLIEDPDFYIVEVNFGKEGHTWFEYDHKPKKEEVQSAYANYLAEASIDAHEAEYGADGRRAFPHLNDEKEEEIEVTIKTGADLIRFIQHYGLEDAPVRVGCEGYTSFNDNDMEIVGRIIDKQILVADQCHYDRSTRYYYLDEDIIHLEEAIQQGQICCPVRLYTEGEILRRGLKNGVSPVRKSMTGEVARFSCKEVAETALYEYYANNLQHDW